MKSDSSPTGLTGAEEAGDSLDALDREDLDLDRGEEVAEVDFFLGDLGESVEVDFFLVRGDSEVDDREGETVDLDFFFGDSAVSAVLEEFLVVRFFVSGSSEEVFLLEEEREGDLERVEDRVDFERRGDLIESDPLELSL